VKEITVVERDRVGLLAEIAEALAAAKINIESISVETSIRNAVIRIIVSDTAKGDKVLKDAGFKVMDSNVIVVKLRDKPGELAKISRLLADKKISVENAYLLEKKGADALLALKVSDQTLAKKLLSGYL
jgi:hypothetical protein